jgi:serine protease Do
MRVITLLFLSFYFCFFGQDVFVFAQDVSKSNSRVELQKRVLSNASNLLKSYGVIADAAEYISPAIVHIEVRRLRTAQPVRGRESRNVQIEVEDSGSGFVIGIGGRNFVMTNLHVVGGVELDAIVIHTFDRRMITPKQVHTNNEFDIALLETDAELTAIDVGDSDKIRIGDLVFAVGSPYGLERTVTMGIISATKRRKIPSSNNQAPACEFFQMDAATNPGNSGGPVLNIRGEVIGLITAIATTGGGSEGIAFAMPIKDVLVIAKQIADGGVAVRPYVGVRFHNVFGVKEHLRMGFDRMIGAHISQVVPDSPADKAKIQAGDVVVSLNGIEVEDGYHLNNLILRSKIGKEIELIVNRNKKEIKLKLTPIEKVSR